MNAGALRNIRVLDFSAMLAGPYCSRYLADLGADVVKVEPPEGDHMRQRPPGRKGHSTYFGHLNAGKRGIVLDLKSPEGLAAARRLVASCDVVLENFRPGVMDRLGLGYQSCKQLNERVIYCSISGYGQTGPRAMGSAYAFVVHAASGYLMEEMKIQGLDKPPTSAVPIADVLAAAFSCFAITSALYSREKSGTGSYIDLSLMECMVGAIPYELQAAQNPLGRERTSYGASPTQDGFILIAPVSERNFAAMCQAMQRPQWLDDPRFATLDRRMENWGELMREIAQWTACHTTAQCEEAMHAAGVPAAAYLTTEQVLQDEHLMTRKALGDALDDAGPFRITNLPFHLHGSAPPPQRRVPRLGEHTAQVMAEWLNAPASTTT